MTHTTLTRPELITILLQNYEDVLNGLRDTKGTGEHIPLMCAAWNSSAYQQLERQLANLRTAEPTLYRHLAGTHIWATHQTVLQCTRCNATYRPWNHPGHHTHGRKTVALQPRIIRQPIANTSTQLAAQGVTWIAQHWHGPITLPLELQHLAA